ncbi:uncharacterized protein LOC131059998 [Cryptomeria japonica]|uniref:uncharacterized protein LOC131059998 n=1 Tax=Cryptomeria japonica TaxID=3369 RepID=UPI0027DA3C43|nr:uncharacterized protein LOC131059998 [Cryptomeria japonica]
MDVGTEFLDRGHMKTIYDNVHHNIHLDSLSLKFVDTEQYQRLRDIKQLGLCYLVYPGAMHSRFEHSLGVYWLAGKAIEQIRRFQGSELDIERNDIMNVKLAGLLHDIGHGPFSHTFESSVLRRILPGSNWHRWHSKLVWRRLPRKSDANKFFNSTKKVAVRKRSGMARGQEGIEP